MSSLVNLLDCLAVADSYRLQTLKALTVLLEGTTVTPVADIVLPATMQGLVFRGRARFGDNDPPTMLSLLEAPRQGGFANAGSEEARRESWALLLQGWCPEDKRHPADPIYSLLDDVEKRLDRINAVGGMTGVAVHSADYMLGGLLTRFQVGQPVVRPPTPDVSSKSFFYLPLSVGLARVRA